MKRILVVCCLALAASVATTDTAAAQGPGPYGFLPFGFYQPYGATYSNSVRNPPYFATNPPVYYGARHSRPYGISPFASPPVVGAGQNYESRLRTNFSQPQIPTPGPYSNPGLGCNSCVSHSSSVVTPVTKGVVRTNPFVESAELIAKN